MKLFFDFFSILVRETEGENLFFFFLIFIKFSLS